MPRTFEVYTTPTHTPGIAGRPNTPTFELWLHPHEFHSYIPALTTEEARIVDEVLACGAPVHGVTEDLERLFLTPSKRRVDPSTPEEAFNVRKRFRKRSVFPLRPRPSGSNRVEQFEAPQVNLDDVEYTTFRLRASPRPIPSPPGRARAPLAELPRHRFVVRPRRYPEEVSAPPTSSFPWQHPRATGATPGVQRTPVARSSSLSRQFSLATPPAQVQVTPCTSNSCQSSNSICPSCGSAYACLRCSPNSSIQSSRSSVRGSAPSQSRAELDRDVRKLERLAIKGRRLRDIIPAMAAPNGVPKAGRQKTEVEIWLEKELIGGRHISTK